MSKYRLARINDCLIYPEHLHCVNSDSSSQDNGVLVPLDRLFLLAVTGRTVVGKCSALFLVILPHNHNVHPTCLLPFCPGTCRPFTANDDAHSSIQQAKFDAYAAPQHASSTLSNLQVRGATMMSYPYE